MLGLGLGTFGVQYNRPQSPRSSTLKLAVIGSRSWSDWPAFQQHLDAILADLDVECLVSGGADGADALAERYAAEHGIPLKIFPAFWSVHGERAGPKRNRQIVEHADRLVAFWDGTSHGTRKTVDLARALGKPVTVVTTPPA